MYCTDCEWDHAYLYQIFRIEGSTKWGFHIGTPGEKEPIIIARIGEYKTKHEAKLCAHAFIAGMKHTEQNTH